jgi:hypothetical protein
MNPLVSDSSNDEIEITDRNLVVALLTFHVTYNHKHRSNNKTIFWFDRKAAQPYLDAWQRGRCAALPVTDIRDVFTAEEAFHSATHDW